VTGRRWFVAGFVVGAAWGYAAAVVEVLHRYRHLEPVPVAAGNRGRDPGELEPEWAPGWPCPTCRAGPGEPCLYGVPGDPRPHRARLAPLHDAAADRGRSLQ